MKWWTDWRFPALVFVLLLPGIFWGLPSAISVQVDSPVPLGSLLFFADRRPSINNIYPAFHQLLLLPFYGAAIACYWLAGGISSITSSWPYGFRSVTGLFSSFTIITNLVSAIMATVLIRFTLPLVRLHRPWIWFGVLCAAFNCVFIYYGRTGNLDLPYNFWCAAAMVSLWRFLDQTAGSIRPLLLAGIAAALAIGSKDQAAGPVLGMGLALLFLSKQPWGSRIRHGVIFSAVILAVYAITAILPHPARWVEHVRFVTSPHAPTPIPATLFGQVLILQHTLRRLIDVYTIPGLLLAAVGAWTAYRQEHRKFWFLMLPSFAYYGLVIAKTRVAYPRFMLTFLVPYIVFSIYGAGAVSEWLAARHRIGRTAWVTLLWAFLAWRLLYGYAPVTYAQVFDIRRQVAAELPGYVAPGSPLLLSRMQGGNLPGAGIYENYRLMLVPGDALVPPSRHAASTLYPYDPNVQFLLQGTGGAGLPWHKPVPFPSVPVAPVREWRYPDWIRENLIVPCFYEYYLFRRTGPVPEGYIQKEADLPDNPG